MYWIQNTIFHILTFSRHPALGATQSCLLLTSDNPTSAAQPARKVHSHKTNQYTRSGIKTHQNFFYNNLKKDYPILITFSTQYSWHNWPSNKRSVSHLTQHLLLHYLVKTERTKCALKSTKKHYKISSFRICGYQQPINYKVRLLCSSTSIK